MIILNINLNIAQEDCLFKNPLCFYNYDVLRYLQVLHKNLQYEKMSNFFFGPFKQKLDDNEFIVNLSEASFGYSLKRVGIKEIGKNKWSLTYMRTILGTNETFKIDCELINDTCRVYVDQKKWDVIFKNNLIYK